MVTIELTFLIRRCHTGPIHSNDYVAEWLPSPWKFCLTLTKLWLKHGRKEDRSIFINLLDKVAENSPDFNFPQANPSFTQHYLSHGEDKTKLFFENLLGSSKCYFIWDKLELSLLKYLLSELNYSDKEVGWIQANLVDFKVEPNIFRPGVRSIDKAVVRRVLIPEKSVDLYENLIRETYDAGNKCYQPLSSTWEMYVFPQDLCKNNQHQYRYLSR